MSVTVDTKWAEGLEIRTSRVMGTVQVAAPVLRLSITREFPGGRTLNMTIEADPSQIAPSGWLEWVEYGLRQELHDAMASSKNPDDARSRVLAKWTRIQTGEATSRGDAVLTEALRLLAGARERLALESLTLKELRSRVPSRDRLADGLADSDLAEDQIDELVERIVAKAETIVSERAIDDSLLDGIV